MTGGMRTDPQGQTRERPGAGATEHGGGPSGTSGSPVRDKGQRESASPSLRASVVVCAYTEDRWPQIQLALASIARQTVPPWQVIVVADHNPSLGQRLEA